MPESQQKPSPAAVTPGSPSDSKRAKHDPAELPFAAMHRIRTKTRKVLVPLMLFTASWVMALAWLGHLNFKDSPFLLAMLACWLLVLPEYFLNITALRFGYKIFSGAQMAAFRLCSGVVCVALVSRFVLGEQIRLQQIVGFGLMLVAMALIASSRFADEEYLDPEERSNTKGVDP